MRFTPTVVARDGGAGVATFEGAALVPLEDAFVRWKR